ERISFTGLGDRMSSSDLVTFLGNPHGRYPDGRMPRLPVTAEDARDIAAFLLMWSKPGEFAPIQPPTADELRDGLKRRAAPNASVAAATLLREKGCTSCHTGLGDTKPRDVPIRATEGCLDGKGAVRYSWHDDSKKAVEAYLRVAAYERHDSPFAERQERLARAGCVRCHQRDSDRPAPIEEIGSTLGGAHLQELP